jgi:prophage antirepressor-like protein
MNIIPFNFDAKQIRVVEINDEPYFFARDLALMLGYSSTNAMNKIIDDEDKKIETFLDGATYKKQSLITESGMYQAIFGSTLESAKSFKRFVTSEVLPSIRKTGGYIHSISNVEPAKLQCDLMFLETAAKVLRVSESGKLGMLRTVQKQHNILNMLPAYAVDAPSDAVDGSSRVTYSLTHLLKTRGICMTTADFNKLLQARGLIEQLERKSTKKPEQLKKFWSITNKGLLYGKNVTSDANQRETAPHWFDSRFNQLLSDLNIKIAEVAA